MFKKKVKINERVYDIAINDENGHLDVVINEKKYSFGGKDFLDSDGGSISEEINNLSKVKSKNIKSPLSGTVINVEVKARDKIKKGQKLLTILAMKMENEIISENDETVKEVRVVKDQIVSKNEILIVFDD